MIRVALHHTGLRPALPRPDVPGVRIAMVHRRPRFTRQWVFRAGRLPTFRKKCDRRRLDFVRIGPREPLLTVGNVAHCLGVANPGNRAASNLINSRRVTGRGLWATCRAGNKKRSPGSGSARSPTLKMRLPPFPGGVGPGYARRARLGQNGIKHISIYQQGQFESLGHRATRPASRSVCRQLQLDSCPSPRQMV